MLRFVILEHRWAGVHWDIMLEREPGGPLRTWAVDTEIVPGEIQAARVLGDHRASYLEYEGEVSGGRGSVSRVDHGTYERLDWGPDLVRARLSGGQFEELAEFRRAVAGTEGSGMAESAGSSSSWTFRLGNFD